MPPQLVAVVVPDGRGQMVQSVQSIQPQWPDTGWCGEYFRNLKSVNFMEELPKIAADTEVEGTA